MTLQEKMLLFRAKNRLSQDDFAKRCGLSKMTICQIENGSQKPSKISKAKIILAMGGSASDIISE